MLKNRSINFLRTCFGHIKNTNNKKRVNIVIFYPIRKINDYVEKQGIYCYLRTYEYKKNKKPIKRNSN